MRKQRQKITEQQTKLQAARSRAIEVEDEIFELMLESARGVKKLVSPKLRGADKPRNARKIEDAVEIVCKHCQGGREVFEVWQTPPDTPLLKHLHEQAVGKASSKEQETFDPEIIVVFGDIDSDDSEVQAILDQRDEAAKDELLNEIDNL